MTSREQFENDGEQSSEQKTYTWSEAVEVADCSASTLRRKLLKDGIKLGATKLKRGWVIPHTTLEALGVLRTVTVQGEQSVTSREQSADSADVRRLEARVGELERECTRLRVENAGLKERADGLERVLAEREKVVALLEVRPKHFWQRWRHHDAESGDSQGE